MIQEKKINTVFITGGARRLGRGLALAFAEQGWNTAFSYFSSEDKSKTTFDEIISRGVKTYKFKADLRDYNSIETGFSKMISDFQTPDVIINNAGIFPPKQILDQIDVSEWNNIMNSNLNSVFHVSKIFSKYAKPNSAIINIASIGAFEIWSGRIPYHVSKSAVIQLTKALARELAPRITVNCVSPGTINISDEPDEKHVPIINESKTPMKRNAKINDVFDACFFFAEKRGFITGENLIVDGGYNLTR